jgi:hypothetical protein
MSEKVIVITARDNVATALEPLQPGERLNVDGASIDVRDAIAVGHKVALTRIGTGAAVVKYGSPIGTATREIEPGSHVHTHNVASGRGRGDLAAASHDGKTA